jgi:hypothetical protein
MDENQPALEDLAAEWGKELGVKIDYFQSPNPETDEAIRTVMNVKGKEIRPGELFFRKTNAVLLLVEFAEDIDSSGKARQLFEFSESASAEYRALSKAATSFGDLFRGGLLQ